MTQEAPSIQLSFAPRSRSGSGCGCLTVIVGGQSFVDDVKIIRDQDRRRIAEAITKKWPDVNWTPAVRHDLALSLDSLAEQEASRAATSDGPQVSAEPTREELLDRMPAHVRDQAQQILGDLRLIDRIAADVDALGVAGEERMAKTIYLVGVSRMLSRPLATIVQGPSSSGKSFVIAGVARLFPPEAVLRISQHTRQSFFYMPMGSMSHRFVVCGERSRSQDPEAADTTRALREMLSDGRLSILAPRKDATGSMTTQRIEQEGPIAYVESTSLTRVFEEDANRCLILTTDEQHDQTRRILRKQAAGAAGRSSRAEMQMIVDRHHALQRMLEPRPVVIDWAERLAEMMGNTRVEMRRAFSHLLSLVEASATLHQRIRQIDAEGRIVAVRADYTLARELMLPAINRAIGQRASDAAQRYFARMVARFQPGEVFDTHQAAEMESVGERSVRGYLTEWCELGRIKQVEKKRGQKPAKWMIDPDSRQTDGPAEDLLPSDEMLFSYSDFRLSDGA